MIIDSSWMRVTGDHMDISSTSHDKDFGKKARRHKSSLLRSDRRFLRVYIQRVRHQLVLKAQ
jgi:hypothetical protein